MNMVLRSIALPVAMAATLPLISLSGQASDHGYIGVKAGWVHGGSACETHAISCDNDAAGGGISVGYQVNDWLALEAGYDYLGTIKTDYPALGHPDVTAHYQGEMQGVEFVAKPFWQVNESMAVFAKLGTLAWHMEVTGDEVDFEHNASDKGWSPLLGAGVEYAFSRHWSTQLAYQWVNDVGGSSTGGTDLNMVNLGVTYHFVSPSEVVYPAPAPAPAPTSTVYKERQWSFNGASFPSNASQLPPELQQALLPVIQRLRTYPQAQVIIRTHTDSRGSTEFNRQLSERRADAVRNDLMAQGVMPTQIKVMSYGENVPLADNTTEAGRHQNRRVELLSPAFEVTAESGRLGAVAESQL